MHYFHKIMHAKHGLTVKTLEYGFCVLVVKRISPAPPKGQFQVRVLTGTPTLNTVLFNPTFTNF